MTEEVKKMLSLNIQMFAESSDEAKVADESKADDSGKSGKEEKKSAEPEKKYTDDELNAISMKNEAKAVKKALKDLGITDLEEAKEILAKAKENKEKENPTKQPTAEELAKESARQVKYINAEIKVALINAGVKREKLERAINLVDKSKILEDGEIDEDKLKTEIDSLTKDWTELLDNKKEEDKKLGFVVGSDGEENKKDNPLEDIERVMGIKKEK